MALKLNITGGPDGLNFEHALFHGDSSARLTITFSVEFTRTKTMVLAEIDGATRTCGDGHEWKITGRIVDPRPSFISTKESGFQGIYSTHNRQGWINLAVPQNSCDADLCYKSGRRFWCEECQNGYCSECGLHHVCFSGHMVRALPQQT